MIIIVKSTIILSHYNLQEQTQNDNFLTVRNCQLKNNLKCIVSSRCLPNPDEKKLKKKNEKKIKFLKMI